jgi:tetratricopeptide (TPR) repeat protein
MEHPMNSIHEHAIVVGRGRATRSEAVAAIADVDVAVSCHARLRGPYSGVDEVLNALVPAAYREWPELIDAHRIELLTAAPGLVGVIGSRPETLVETTPHEERTRYFGLHLIQAASQGVVTFLLEYARLSRPRRAHVLTLAFDDVQAADPTAQDFLALLLRRADPGLLHVLLGAAEGPLDPDLDAAVAAHAERVYVAPSAPEGVEYRAAAELARGYVSSDGTSDDLSELRAYDATPPAERARLHDERAAELESRADWGLRLGAIPYHRERGSDPAGAGRRALREALEYCVAVGYSAATVDFGMRGRAVCDPVEHQHDYSHFTAKAANALVPMGRHADSLELYRELRRRYSIPQVHMTCAYAIAMLHTRSPRDHDQALEWANSGRALASAEPDPIERAYFEVFADNGIALIEMHRGNLERSLELVSDGIERLERELPDDSYVVHRTQLLHNRARVLVALGRLDEAHADFTRLIALDPYYVEYHSDRGALNRRRGDLSAALSDYDRAVAVSVPMAELHFNRASVRAQAGLVEESIADLDYVLELDPDFRDGHLTRGSLHLELGRAQEAHADALAGLALSGGDARLLSLLALSHQAMGARRDAVAAFGRALEVDPGFAPALVNRAVLAYDLDDLDGAHSDLTRALELMGDSADVLYNRGFVLQQQERWAEAIRDFSRALSLPDADRAELLRRRAECQAALGGRAVSDDGLVTAISTGGDGHGR